MRVFATSVIAAAALTALCVPAAQAATAPSRAKLQAIDLGDAADAQVTVSVHLKGQDMAGLAHLIDALHTPGNAQFHKFLSVAEFHQRFDPTAATVAAASQHFTQAGLSVAYDGGHILDVTGSPAAVAAVFGVKLHDFAVPAHGGAAATRFHAALGTPKIADAAVAAQVTAVVGLNSQPRYASNVKVAPNLGTARPVVTGSSTATGNLPQQWTVSDLASYYNVNPLYKQGFHGEGMTLGIVTLASFTTSDAFEYWGRVGLTTNPDRITVIPVNGGSGPVSDAGGSGETTLDVEQSGGLAPAANMLVYEAPNTSQGFLKAFQRVVTMNTADTISCSWGEFEWFDTLSRSHWTGDDVTDLKAYNQVFMQAAAQGQSLFIAQGDEGAYEANRGAPVPQFNPILSVGAPGSSPYATSAGGTTVPVTLQFSTGYVVTVPTEQAWGWDYLSGFCASIGYSPVDCGIWGVGSGGGVSSYNPLPTYQKNVMGIQVTQAGQSLTDTSTNPPTTYVTLPTGFAGRNVPDVSLNADPESGYALDYTDQSGQFSIAYGWGGTSFVAPQLNGITSLLAQKAGGRLGLLNFPLYALAVSGKGYAHGSSASLNDITAGDNWYYNGAPGYDLATGVGTLNVAKFSNILAGSSGN